MEGYTIRRTLKGGNIGVYFRDNVSPPLFVMSDIAQLVNGDYIVNKGLIAAAGPDHCFKIQATTSYMIWVCDFEGLCNIVHNMAEEEQGDIIETVSSLTKKEYETVPAPSAVKHDIRTAAAETFDSVVCVMGKYFIRYVFIDGAVYFAAQDIRRCFQKNASYVEEKFAAVSQEDKLRVTFKDDQTRICLNSNAVEVIVNQMMEPDAAVKFMVQLISKCKPKTVRSSNVILPKRKRRDKTMRNDHLKDLKTTSDFSVISYDNISVNNKQILTCFVKKNPDDPDEEITPLFWATSLGFYTDYGDFSRFVSKFCNEKDYCKISIPDTKKFNIKMVTLEGVRTVLSQTKFEGESKKLMADLEDAVGDYLRQHKAELDFSLEKYNTRRKASVEEETVEEKQPTQEEPVKEQTNDLEETAVTFRGQQLRMSVEINKNKNAIIYYDIKQLCQILGVEEDSLPSFNRLKDSNGSDSLISIYDVADVFAGVTENSADIVQELFDISKPAVIAIADSMGMKIKDNTTTKTENFMSQLLSSSDGRNYTLGAIILAEKFREIILLLKRREKSTNGLPGPSNGKLLEDLWRYIDCQEPDHDIPFGFKKQVVAVNERYQRLKTIFEG